jgi:chaperonin GroEL
MKITNTDKVLQGIAEMAEVVGSTLGPKGRNVLISNKIPVLTKDGATVCRNINYSDPQKQTGASLVKQCAQASVDQAGDGSSSTTLLLNALLKNGKKALLSGLSPMELRRQLDMAGEVCLNFVDAHSQEVKSVEDLITIATISANNDKKIGEIIGKAVSAVGPDSTILLEQVEGKPGVRFVLTPGYEFERGLVSQHFVQNSHTFSTAFEDCLVWILPVNLTSLAREKQAFIQACEKIKATGKPVLILCNSCDGDYFKFFATAKEKGNWPVAVVTLPAHGQDRSDLASDIADYVGATIPDLTLGDKLFDNFDIGTLGHAKYVLSDHKKTLIEPLTLETPRLAEKIESLRALLESDKVKDKDFVRKRLTALSVGVGNLVVSGRGREEQSEINDLVEDALLATRCAARSGVCPGGAVTYLRCVQLLTSDLPDLAGQTQTVGGKVLAESLKAPLQQLCKLGSVSFDVVAAKYMESDNFNFGYNFATDSFEDLVESGVLDAAAVIKAAIKNSITYAGLILSTDYLIQY